MACLRDARQLACVASVAVWFRSKERGTRVADRATNGATENLIPRSFFAPNQHGNACYAGYTATGSESFTL